MPRKAHQLSGALDYSFMLTEEERKLRNRLALKRWREKHREESRLKNRLWMREWRKSHPEEARERDRRFYREHYQEQKEIRNKRVKEALLKLKTEILTHYGNGKLACIRCGFNDIRALSIDHIEGGGRKDRKKFAHNVSFYRWLRQNYPIGLQTLCMNCQFIKQREKKEYGKGSLPKEVANEKDNS